jgi:hypothetical protein
MIRYVPSSAAAALTTALWGLARPEHLRTEADTSEMFGWVDDLQTPPKRWLEVDTTFTITVHPEAVLDGIADILQPWIDDGSLPSDTNTTLETFIQSKRGLALTVYDAFPPLFKSMSKTHAEMIAAGWLPNPEVTP